MLRFPSPSQECGGVPRPRLGILQGEASLTRLAWPEEELESVVLILLQGSSTGPSESTEGVSTPN